METVISDKKELAEKIAGMLGWEGERVMCAGELCIQTANHSLYGIERRVFSWPTVGLCIEKARELGWRPWWHDHKFLFVYEDDKEFTSTGRHDVNAHGDIEAIIRAFAEIPMEVENDN